MARGATSRSTRKARRGEWVNLVALETRVPDQQIRRRLGWLLNMASTTVVSPTDGGDLSGAVPPRPLFRGA